MEVRASVPLGIGDEVLVDLSRENVHAPIPACRPYS
jgi:hypothetical protein